MPDDEMTAGRPEQTNGRPTNEKQRDLEPFKREQEGTLTTNQGVPIDHTDDSLKAGPRGPTLMEDFHFREKMTQFDHESMPERVVHARGSGAHGIFQVYEPMGWLTRAAFLQDPARETPVFVRFSTVVGSRGSADTVRDVRGFATKFYTDEGNFDLVGNNMPVFFIQDGIKFPDLVHAIKPMPDNEIPQASAAHDTFWDFASLMPEITHMLMWVLSDRALPRSYAMMQGFGVHTFRMVNAEGTSRFVKFHWRPLKGIHSLVWDETQKIAGKDPDFNRRDLWEAIERGDYPEYELGVQVIEEADEHRFDFDLLDATKIVPEEEVPLQPIGRMTLNRNPDNFYAETEQVAFHIGNLVPGIDVTNDPLLQGRLFSYLDTQLGRFHSSNFHELPINRPIAPVRNNQGAGFMRMTIGKGKVNYFPNSLGGNEPAPSPERGYTHHPEQVEGPKVRDRGEKFRDFFSQATLFWNSQTDTEKQHIIDAAHFELGKVESKAVRERVVHELFDNVDHEFARQVAMGIGIDPPPPPGRQNHGRSSRNLSQQRSDHTTFTAKGRKVAILLADGYDEEDVRTFKQRLTEAGVQAKVVSKFLGALSSDDGSSMEADMNHVSTASVMFDAVFVPGGDHVEALMEQGDALHFVNEAFKHHKPLAASGRGIELLERSDVAGIRVAGPGSNGRVVVDQGVVTVRGSSRDEAATRFIEAIAQHRHWNRPTKAKVPA
jgi:catalase